MFLKYVFVGLFSVDLELLVCSGISIPVVSVLLFGRVKYAEPRSTRSPDRSDMRIGL